MKLDTYLKKKKLTAHDFAQQIGVADFTLQRYLAGRVPTPEIVVSIYKTTEGKVAPNDFYNLK